MNVAFIVTSYNACKYWRVTEPAREFPGAELIFATHGFTHDVLERAAAADVVHLHYACLPEEMAAIAELRRGSRAAIVVDYDDNLFQMFARDPFGRETVLRCAALADLITVTTPELARVYGNAVRGVPVCIIPNFIDVRDWTPAEIEPGASVIAYLGSRSHTRDFLAIQEAVWSVLRKRPDWSLRTIGCDPLPVPSDLRDRVTERPWLPVTEVLGAVCELGAEIGIAPLVDTPFNRGRSALKWLQFGALGVPMVASAVPPYLDTIADGHDGFLAADLPEWEERLLRLMDDDRLRDAVGGAARRRVVDKFSLERDRDLRTEVYRKAIQHRAERIRASSQAKGGRGVARAAEPVSAGSSIPAL